MAMKILLLGLKHEVVEEVRSKVNARGSTIFTATGVEEAGEVLGRERIDAVIMGGGLPLETRLEVVREVFRISDSTTVHMKDVASGPEGYLPFVESLLAGLSNAARADEANCTRRVTHRQP